MNNCLLVGKIVPNTLEKNDSYCNTAWDFTMYVYDKVDKLPEVIYCRAIDNIAEAIRKICSTDKYTWISAEGRIKDMDNISKAYILIDSFKFIEYEDVKETSYTYTSKRTQKYEDITSYEGFYPHENPGIGWEL